MSLGNDLTNQRAFNIVRHLQDASQARTFVEAAHDISDALYLLGLAGGTRLNGRQVGEILAALDAVIVIAQCWREHYSPRQIVHGLRAAGTVVDWWEQRDNDRLRFGDRISDARAYVRMLRNDMHNVCLLQEIGKRARRRRASIIGDLLKSPEKAA